MAQVTHLDEGALRALLDGELAGADRETAVEHVAACQACAGALEELRVLATTVSGALAVVDISPDLGRARATVRRRTAARSASPRTLAVRGGAGRLSLRLPRPTLARAAAVLIALGGVVAIAVPGSPLRAWIAVGWEGVVRALRPEAGTLTPPAPAAAERESGATGVRVGPAGGRVRISLTQVPPGAVIRVQLTDAGVAGVYAGVGTRFRTAPGLVEAAVAGTDVRVEIPRAAQQATVEVGGELFLRKVGDRLELLGPQRDSAGAEIRFRLPPGGPER
ncbi:MAG: hypothetical protein HY704_00335 [Gemmatimonadetes bacterium]|nr:hypothetical protein [Gemmatimonadota bacterium]